MLSLLASRPVAAAGTCNFRSLAGSAAAGIAEFQVGRAGFPVAGGTREFLVLFSAGAGVQGGGFLFMAGFCGIV
jgi:hypothetical protein